MISPAMNHFHLTWINNELVVATTNPGKLKEFQTFLYPLSILLKSLNDFGPLPDAVEDGQTFEKNARKKALHYAHLLRKTVLADDSGLQIDALNLDPGVYSARFAGVDHSDRAVRDRANNEKVLHLLESVPDDKRTARFRCCLCMADPDKILLEVTGTIEGKILREPIGNNGFGYDPIFYVPGHHKTIAQMTHEEKNCISHRGNALRNFLHAISNE